MKTLGFLLGFLLSAHIASACFWITGTTYQGTSKRASGVGAAINLRNSLRMEHRDDGMRMQAALVNSTNFNDRSDYAVSLVYLGEVNEAVDLLRTLEQEQPGTYVVAANLGTALELQGNNEAALRWIREAIRRNPQSHHGTEWLHAKILEAKIAHEKDPDYFKSHSVLEIDPKEASSSITIDGQTFSSIEVGQAIQHQLQERLQFVKPPDQAVASLLFDYAAIEAATNILESAKGLLKMAVEYGYPPERVQPMIRIYDGKIAARKMSQNILYGFLFLVAIGVLIFLYKVEIFVFSSKDRGSERKNEDKMESAGIRPEL
jgi:tetratricopeptide (TPR) repeat protein